MAGRRTGAASAAGCENSWSKALSNRLSKWRARTAARRETGTMNMMDSLGWEFVDVVLAEGFGARSASHDSPIGSARIHFKSLFFEQSGIENRRTEPTIGVRPRAPAACSSTARGQGARAGRAWRGGHGARF